MGVDRGRKFCAEHSLTEETEDDNNNRMPCPYDSKHSCYINKLQKHLKKCNARPKPLPDYISPSINSLDVDYPNAKEFDYNYTIGSVDCDLLMELIRKVESIFSEIPIWKESILSHNIVQEILNKNGHGMNSKKHLIQNSSLLENMEECQFVADDITFIEFGAGRGSLTYYLAQALENKENWSLVLVDKASPRHKSDNKLKENSDTNILRIRADIADLDLPKVPLFQESENEIVGICKHLCGMATDLALRCLLNAKKKNMKIRGVVMAPCCHHRCKWSSFVGKEFLLKKDFDPKHFTALCSLTSWATCGYGKSGTGDIFNQDASNNERYRKLCLNQSAREEIGRKCKIVLDYARLVELQKAGFTGNLVYFVKEDISPENVCLIARS